MAYPPVPDVAPGVRSLLQGRGTRRPWWSALHPVPALTLLPLVVLGAAALVLSPAAGEALADRLGVGGVLISTGAPPTTMEQVGEGLGLERPVTLVEAAQLAEFAVLVPHEPGPPDEVYWSNLPPSGMVHLVWRAGDQLPAAPGTGVGLMVSQFRGGVEEGLFEKVLGEEVSVELVTVRGRRGFWVEGAHSILYVRPDGQVQEETVRLAAEVLVWEEEGVTIRVESALPLEEVLSIAESMRPAETR
ncbi:MAG: DUF4367 domain-containing protein [Actinomycetota bacterium]|nr:DUF4367 domain-containing protein [Actinomycetota bacterium]